MPSSKHYIISLYRTMFPHQLFVLVTSCGIWDPSLCCKSCDWPHSSLHFICCPCWWYFLLFGKYKKTRTYLHQWEYSPSFGQIWMLSTIISPLKESPLLVSTLPGSSRDFLLAYLFQLGTYISISSIRLQDMSWPYLLTNFTTSVFLPSGFITDGTRKDFGVLIAPFDTTKTTSWGNEVLNQTTLSTFLFSCSTECPEVRTV